FPFCPSHNDNGPQAWRDGYSASCRETGFFDSAIAGGRTSVSRSSRRKTTGGAGGLGTATAGRRTSRGWKASAVGLADKFGAGSGVGHVRQTVRRRGGALWRVVLFNRPTEHNW